MTIINKGPGVELHPFTTGTVGERKSSGGEGPGLVNSSEEVGAGHGFGTESKLIWKLHAEVPEGVAGDFKPRGRRSTLNGTGTGKC